VFQGVKYLSNSKKKSAERGFVEDKAKFTKQVGLNKQKANRFNDVKKENVTVFKLAKCP
jgi:hypothetical protein